MSAKLSTQQVLDKAEIDLKPKVAALTSSTNSLGANPTVEQVLTCNNNALIVRKAIEAFKADILNSQRPVSVADGRKSLKLLKELQVSWNSVLADTINKKPSIDALPIANLSGLIGQSLKEMYATMISVADALQNAAPAELLEEGLKCRKEYEDSLKKALSVYQ